MSRLSSCVIFFTTHISAVSKHLSDALDLVFIFFHIFPHRVSELCHRRNARDVANRCAASLLPAGLQGPQFTRNGDLIRDLDKYVRSGQPCFSQLQNEVKNPFAYAKTRYGKEPKFVYHYYRQ